MLSHVDTVLEQPNQALPTWVGAGMGAGGPAEVAPDCFLNPD